ncbi:hypothetical protein WDU94_015068 [Cyamophila willieti]
MAASDKKQFYPAADRNKQPILDILKKHISISESKKCLEIASGSGQHISFFAPHFPNIEFHPSEECQYLFDSIDEYAKTSGLTNVKPARFIDASSQPEKWFDGTPVEKGSFDYIYNCNMIHLVPLQSTEGLFKGSNYYLKPHGLLITYGAYADKGVLTPQSNIDFNESIKSRNPAHGIRDITLELEPLAKQYNIELKHKYDMPANNKILIWQKL